MSLYRLSLLAVSRRAAAPSFTLPITAHAQAMRLCVPSVSAVNSHRHLATKAAQSENHKWAQKDPVQRPGSALMLHEPQPIRAEFIRDTPLETKDLEQIPVQLGSHVEPKTFADKVALALVRSLRIPSDMFFRKQYMHRAVTLETVAAIPGMVGGVLRHLRSLRKMKHDGGWINHLLHEAENERMHLMVWMKHIQPSFLERMLVLAVQGVAFNLYFITYIFHPSACHRFAGYLEEEAVRSYTSFLEEIDAGRIPNTPAHPLAISYWNLAPDATLRDVVLAVRADEATHRDVNHHLADRIRHGVQNLRKPFEGVQTN